jgi:cathepsin F
MLKGLLILAVLCFSSQVNTLNFLESENTFDKISYFFHKFNTQHKKEHKTYEEFTKKLIIFSENLFKFAEFVHFEGEEPKFSPFFDISTEEFAKTHLNNKFDPSFTKGLKHAQIEIVNDLPKEKDWRKEGAVTPVKNQGQCGSCWAFSTIGTVESQNAIVNGKLVSLSESQIIDCDTKGENKGCQGGLMIEALKYIIGEGGLMSEHDYPYVPRQEKCKYDAKKSVVSVKGFEVVDPKKTANRELYKSALINRGPIAVALNAIPLQFYFGGIFHPIKVICNPEKLDHGVVIVGYGTEGGKDYWIVKNSWGPAWGEQGYFRIYNGDQNGGENVCGILNENDVIAVVNKK